MASGKNIQAGVQDLSYSALGQVRLNGHEQAQVDPQVLLQLQQQQQAPPNL
jgi:hypothetical protein